MHAVPFGCGLRSWETCLLAHSWVSPLGRSDVARQAAPSACCRPGAAPGQPRSLPLRQVGAEKIRKRWAPEVAPTAQITTNFRNQPKANASNQSTAPAWEKGRRGRRQGPINGGPTCDGADAMFLQHWKGTWSAQRPSQTLLECMPRKGSTNGRRPKPALPPPTATSPSSGSHAFPPLPLNQTKERDLCELPRRNRGGQGSSKPDRRYAFGLHHRRGPERALHIRQAAGSTCSTRAVPPEAAAAALLGRGLGAAAGDRQQRQAAAAGGSSQCGGAAASASAAQEAAGRRAQGGQGECRRRRLPLPG